MHVTLGQIRAFVTAASTASFTRAARVLHLSQPALTSRIRQLEDALSLRLFDRNTRSVELTPLGREVLPVFRRVVDDFETAVVNARDSVMRAKRVIRLACLPSCAASLLPDLIRDFSRDNQGVTFVVRDALNNTIPTLVRSGEVDFGIAVEDPRHSDLEWAHLFGDTLLAVSGPDESSLGPSIIPSADTLATRPLILMARGSSVREIVDEAFAAAGLTALARCEVQYISTAVALARAGLGVAILPSTAVEIETMPEIRTRRIADPGFSRSIGLVQRKGSALHPTAAAFIARLCAAAKERRATGSVGRVTAEKHCTPPAAS